MNFARQQTGTSMFPIGLAGGTRPTKTTSFVPIIALAAAIFGLLYFSARFSESTGGIWDRELLLRLNSFAATDKLYVWGLTHNNCLFRGFPIFFSLAVLWFAGDSRERRSRMLAGLLAACVATVLSVWIQFHLTTHARPLLDPALALNIADPRWTLDWDRRDSFPSDTTTLFSALTAVIFLEKRLVGLFCFVWTATIISIPRVIFGWHYPTDVTGGLVLGSACVFLFTAIPYLRTLFERVLIMFEGRMHIIHACLVIFLSDASVLFSSLQQLGKQFVRLW